MFLRNFEEVTQLWTLSAETSFATFLLTGYVVSLPTVATAKSIASFRSHLSKCTYDIDESREDVEVMYQ